MTGSDYSQVVQQHNRDLNLFAVYKALNTQSPKHCVSNLLKTFGMWNDALDSTKSSHTVKTSAPL